MDSDATFLRQIDGLIRERVSAKVSWGELTASLAGLYPELVLASLRRLDLLHFVRFHNDGGPDYSSQNGERLATPHPLDFSWWFDQETLELLFERTISLAQPNQNVLMLGAPMLAEMALRRGSRRRITLLDKDLFNRLTDAAPHWHCVDLMRDPLPSMTAHLVIADPPWYLEEMRGFLWCARELAAIGSPVLMSLPPRWTRPGVLEERRELINWAQKLGLRSTRLEPKRLGYRSPLFERNALKAAFVPAPSDTWRRGDLMTFECEKTQTPQGRPLVHSERWEEVVVSSVRIRVRPHDNAVPWNPELISIVDGDILPTVSRRDSRRGRVDVWTSGNRVFRCGDTKSLLLILRALRDGSDPVSLLRSERGLTSSHEPLVRQIIEQLNVLIRTEEAELAQYKGSQRHLGTAVDSSGFGKIG